MIKHILVPTDGYGLEDHVIKYVAKAFPFAEFHIISVVNTYERGVQLTDLLYREMKKSAEKAVEHAKDILFEMGVEDVHISIIEGLPSKMITRYAKNHNIDLIAMRVYSRKSTASAHRLGSTVKNVLKRSQVPVLTLAHECDKVPIKRIMLLTDGTRKSKRAENFAVLFAETLNAEIEAIYLTNNDEHHGEKILTNVSWKAEYLGVKVKKRLIPQKDFESLTQTFSNNDLVVMGIGKRFLFFCRVGHLSQFVATHSPIPVIFVRSLKERWSPRRRSR